MAKCNYCSGKITLIEDWDEIEDHEPDSEVTIQGNYLMLDSENGTLGKTINYCPMCGNRVEVSQ